MFWTENNCDRYRENGQLNVFQIKTLEEVNIMEDDLQRIINRKVEALKNIIFAYNENITVSNDYFYKCRKELEDQVYQEGMSYIWFTFITTENNQE